MSQTFVVNEAYRSRLHENRLNEVVRHCRIGGVFEKRSALAPVAPMDLGIAQPFIWPSVFGLPAMSPRKCSCQPGSACGNAACPYAFIAVS